jgi:hypothetical protein
MPRPRKEIDAEQVRKLAGMGLTVDELAAFLGCSKRTLERRFDASIKDGRTRLNASLKRKQYVVAMRGSVPMLIWLGKQYLKQTERVVQAPPDPDARPRLVIPEFDGRFESDNPGGRPAEAGVRDPDAEA